MLGVNGNNVGVHRLAYELWTGPIPKGLKVRHKCDNPPCINPEHLETGTQADNMHDMMVRDRHYRAMTDAEKDLAWSLYVDDDLSYVAVGAVLDINYSTVRREIKNRLSEIYTHISQTKEN